jgi:hypothetical protein
MNDISRGSLVFRLAVIRREAFPTTIDQRLSSVVT